VTLVGTICIRIVSGSGARVGEELSRVIIGYLGHYLLLMTINGYLFVKPQHTVPYGLTYIRACMFNYSAHVDNFVKGFSTDLA
jgi:hypothetical protein